MTRELTELHTALAGTGGPAGQLHCLYVAADSASDPEQIERALGQLRSLGVRDGSCRDHG